MDLPDIDAGLFAVKELVAQVKKGNCILFLGAGVHAPPPSDSAHQYPEEQRPLLGSALAEKLSSEFALEKKFPQESPHDLQRVSLFIETEPGLGRKTLLEALQRYLREGKRPSPALEMLARLPFKIIVTTNYDGLLERALVKCNKEPGRFVYDKDPERRTLDMADDPTPERPLLFKMHGDFEQRDSIVITDEDYITFVQRMSDKEQHHPVPQTVRYRMQQWPTLFVGYSLRDYNLRLLFRTLRWRVDPANFPTSFSIDHRPDPLILRVWQDERRFIAFVTKDLWTFVPWFYREVCGEEYSS